MNLLVELGLNVNALQLEFLESSNATTDGFGSVLDVLRNQVIGDILVIGQQSVQRHLAVKYSPK